MREAVVVDTSAIYKRAELEIEAHFSESAARREYGLQYLHYLAGLRVRPDISDLTPDDSSKVR
jgi:hypothetical protein